MRCNTKESAGSCAKFWQCPKAFLRHRDLPPDLIRVFKRKQGFRNLTLILLNPPPRFYPFHTPSIMSSPASPSAATPPPSIIPSTGAQSTLSLDELHHYIREQACNRAGPVVDPPNAIDPHLLASSSIFIGQRRLKGGRDDDTTVRLMFRCVWPPKSVSRHVIIHMKPSVPEEALAQK